MPTIIPMVLAIGVVLFRVLVMDGDTKLDRRICKKLAGTPRLGLGLWMCLYPLMLAPLLFLLIRYPTLELGALGNSAVTIGIIVVYSLSHRITFAARSLFFAEKK